MANWDYTRLSEGTILNAASLNDRFDAAETALNDLDERAIAREALQHAHLPPPSGRTELFSNGYTAQMPFTLANYTTAEDYNVALLDGAGDASSAPDLQVFSGQAPNAPYGPCTLDEGWRIPAYANVIADAMEVTLDGATTLTEGQLRGLKVRGSITVKSMATTMMGTTAGWRGSIWMALGYEDGAGSRYIVEDTVMGYSGDAVDRGPVTNSWFLQPADIAAGNGTVKKVFWAISGRIDKLRGWTLATGSNEPHLDIVHYSMYVVPIRAGDLETL